MTIRNTPPGIPTVVVTPDPAPYWATLECTATSTDDDGDPVTYRYQWYRFYGEQEGRTWRRLSAEYTSAGEQWRCRVWPNDGEENGGSAYSDSVTIMGAPELSWLGTTGYLEDGVRPYRDVHLAWFTFRVRYTGGPPTHVRLHLFRYGVPVAGSPYDMNPGAGDPGTGQIFWFKRRLCKGTYSYFFRANDGHDPAIGDPTYELDGPVAHNRAPRLEWLGLVEGGPEGYEYDAVDPQGRQMPGTGFLFAINYVDREHDPAEYVRLHIARREGATDHEVDGSPFAMEGPHNWPDGQVYAHWWEGTEEGRYVYWFEAREVAPAPFTSHDAYGVPTWWRRNMIWVFNAPPQLRWAPGEHYRGDSPSDGLHPNTGSPGDSFTFRVQYRDQEGTEPAYVRLHLLKLIGGEYVEIAASPYTMTTTDTDFTRANYSVTITRPNSGQFRYYFSASDGDKPAIGEPSWHRMPGPQVNGTASAGVKIASINCQQKGAGAQVTFALSSQATVTAQVLNMAGRPVKALMVERPTQVGTHTLAWDGRCTGGTLVPPGIYLVRVEARQGSGERSQVLRSLRIAR